MTGKNDSRSFQKNIHDDLKKKKFIFLSFLILFAGGLHWYDSSEDVFLKSDSDWLRYARIADADFWFEEEDEEIFDAIEKAHEQGISV
ncbi:MAG: hypothetical protein ACE5HW_01035, partial [Candidatus Methanofastidiosia archaeon]